MIQMGSLRVRPLPRSRTDELEGRLRSVQSFLPEDLKLRDVVRRPGTCWFLLEEFGEDVGLVGLVNIDYGHCAEAHITFWDRRLRGRATACQALAVLLMEACDLAYLYTLIPRNLRLVLRFAKEVGFTEVYTHQGVSRLVLVNYGG